MLLLDAVLRFPSLTLSVMLIVLMARDAWRYSQAKLAITLLISAIASSTHTMPAGWNLPDPIFNVAVFIAIPGAALQWWFARSILEDGFCPTWPDWALMAAACLFKLGWSLQGVGISPPFHDFRYVASYSINLFLAGHIVWIAISGMKTDLVERRRGVRLWFSLFIAAGGMLNLIMELLGQSGEFETLFIHATTLPMLVWAFVWLTRLEPDRVFFSASQPDAQPQLMSDVPVRLAPSLQKLDQIMQSELGYRDPDLSVRLLAERVGLPEHQLRRLINQSLGHRNFAAFLNGYRLAYVKTALSDPDRALLPILTIAMEAGYKTLSTFNRAFRSSEQETPTEFRRRSLESAQDDTVQN